MGIISVEEHALSNLLRISWKSGLRTGNTCSDGTETFVDENSYCMNHLN